MTKKEQTVSFANLKEHCLALDLPFQEFVRPEPRPLLAHSLDDNNLQIDVFGQSHVYLAYVENKIIFNQGYLLDPEQQQLFAHGLSYTNYPTSIKTSLEVEKQLVHYQDKQQPLTLSLDEPEVTIEEEVLLLWGTANFGHWLFQYLARLACLHYRPELKSLKLLINDKVGENNLAYLKRLGFSEEQFIISPKTVFAKKLWVPSIVNYRGHYDDTAVYLWPSSLHYLRHHFLGEQAAFPAPSGLSNGARRIYVSRNQDARWRRIVNEDALLEILKLHGFEVVTLSHLSVDEQISLFSQAEIALFPPGAADQMTMLMPLRSTAILIQTEQTSGIWGRVWSFVLGNRYVRVNAKPVPIKRPTVTTEVPLCDFDIEVDLAEMAKIIEKTVYLHERNDLDFSNQLQGKSNLL